MSNTTRTSNIWALFVHPDRERRGCGQRLADAIVTSLSVTRAGTFVGDERNRARAQRLRGRTSSRRRGIEPRQRGLHYEHFWSKRSQSCEDIEKQLRGPGPIIKDCLTGNVLAQLTVQN